MSQRDSPLSESNRAMLDEIRRVFGDVQRGEGVTLHETEVIDSHGSDEERQEARRKDTDRHWWEVEDEWIKRCSGMCFLDDAGFRYYVPAFMSYWIRNGEEPWGLEFSLEKHAYCDRIFSFTEKKTIARFLNHVGPQFEDLDLGETLDPFWRRYFDAPVETSIGSTRTPR